MAKKYYDENGNEVKVKQKRGGCLKWLLYGFILMILLGACGALLDDGEEEVTEEQKTEEIVDKEESKEEDDSDEEKSEPSEEKTKEEEQSEPTEEKTEDTEETKTVEDIANEDLNNVTKAEEYDGELTITFEPHFSSNDERMLIILTEQISRFLLDAKENAENLDDYDSIVVMANKDSAVLYSLRITNDQFNELPENNVDEQVRVQKNMEDYVEQVSMLPQYRKVDL